MEYKIIHIPGKYLLVVDKEAKRVKGDWVYDSIEDVEEGSQIVERATHGSHTGDKTGWWKIIAHLPLNGSPELQGVDWLPDYVQSSSTPKIPVGFRTEHELFSSIEGDLVPVSLPDDIRTIKKKTNAQGKAEWVGEWVF